VVLLIGGRLSATARTSDVCGGPRRAAGVGVGQRPRSGRGVVYR